MKDFKGNIFSDLPDSFTEEFFKNLLEGKAFKLELIVSSMGYSTPPGEWYDQQQHEWVMLLSGSAGLLLEGEEKVIELQTGDYIDIPAHKRHRVEWTDSEQKTCWLTIHYSL